MATLSLGDRPPQHGHRTRGSRAGVNSFMALDGEGITENGKHSYVLLGIGKDQCENRGGLGWSEILEFLYSHYAKKTAYVGFFLGYDFTQIFSKLPEERARMLLTIEGRAKRVRHVKGNHNIAPHPVEYARWQFDILGTRRLRIRPKLCNCTIQSCACRPKPPWMYICDAGGFFQTSLINVINPSNWKDPIVTPGEFEAICIGKARRETAELDDEMRKYNLLENNILERALTELDRGFRQLGICLSPSQWYGPGQAAQEWLKKLGVPTRKDIEALAESWPNGLLEAAMASYFGGWFELFIHGHIAGFSYEYDINNAYPYIISKLPCLLHGKWESGMGKPNVAPGQYCLVYARTQTCAYGTSYFYGKKHYIGAMLHRNADGRILRPKITEGWYWWHELQAARKAKCVSSIIYNDDSRWYKYSPCECKPPAREMESLYTTRLKMGKDSAIGKAAKLVANSTYGKFAQSVGKPLFGNPIYASLITAGCRTMILEAIASHPEGKKDVAMVATDAVYFLHPHPTLPVSDKLGEWSYKKRSNLTLFKPGVYWDEAARNQIASGKTPIFKARGVNASAFAGMIAEIDRQFDWWDIVGPPNYQDTDLKLSGGEWPRVNYEPSFGMTTSLQALIQGKWSRAGQLITYTEENMPVQSSIPFQKRSVECYRDEAGVYRTEPLPWDTYGGPIWNIKTHRMEYFYKSTPYSKTFGYTDQEIEQMTWGETPEGPIGDLFMEALGVKK